MSESVKRRWPREEGKVAATASSDRWREHRALLWASGWRAEEAKQVEGCRRWF